MVDCFLPYGNIATIESVLPQLRQSKVVHHIFLLVKDASELEGQDLSNCSLLETDNIMSLHTMNLMAESAEAEFSLFCMKTSPFVLGYQALERMVRVATDADASMLYSDHYSVEAGKTVPHPVIDYQLGSIRDDFDFGSLVLVRSDKLGGREQSDKEWQYAGWYSQRLALSRAGEVFHLNEYLYTEEEVDLIKNFTV